MRTLINSKRFGRNALLATAVLAISGCVNAPASVGKYSYEYLEKIGAIESDGSCKKLRDKYESDGKMTETQIRMSTESCKATARQEQHRYEYRQKKKADKAYFAKVEKEEAAQAEQNAEMQAEREALEKRRAEGFQESLSIIEKRINETQVASQLSADLDDALVNNQMTVSPGFPLPDLKRVLACAELKFEPKKVTVNQSGRDLSVFYKDALTNSGEMDITMNFRETSDFWLMTDYVVGTWTLSNNTDKGQMIVQMNAAKPCNAMDVLEGVMSNQEG